MKKNSVKYSIAEPCHEDWAAMTPIEKGSFCNSCAKPVIDFTQMRDQEILRFMSAATGSVCGRMASHQLNREMMPYMDPSRSFSLQALVLGTALVTFSALNAYGQGAPVRGKVEQHESVTKGKVAMEPIVMGDTVVVSSSPELKRDTVLSGKVADYNRNLFIDSASVTVYDENGVVITAAFTNDKGEFELSLQKGQHPYALVTSKEHYQDVTMMFDSLLTYREIRVEMTDADFIMMGLIRQDPPAEIIKEKK